jgi:hypothetical protein
MLSAFTGSTKGIKKLRAFRLVKFGSKFLRDLLWVSVFWVSNLVIYKVKFVWEREYDTSKDQDYEDWTRDQVLQDALDSIGEATLEINTDDLAVTVS